MQKCLLFLLLFIACQNASDQVIPDAVHLRLAGAPDRLHPLLSRSGYAGQINTYRFEGLLRYDPQTLVLVPQLAAERPAFEQTEKGFRYTFSLRGDAFWQKGAAVTPQDVVFTLKAVLNPKLAGGRIRTFLDFVEQVQVEGQDIHISTDYPYFLAEAVLGTLPIFRESVYDPSLRFRQVSIDRLTTEEPSWADEETQLLEQMAQQFSDFSLDWDTTVVSGSGPYRLALYEEGERIVLRKKAGSAASHLPDELHYHMLPDETTASTMLKNGDLDILDRMAPGLWQELKGSLDTSNFIFAHPMQLQYTYIAINMQQPGLRDRKLRRALAHLIDVDWIIDQLLQGQAYRMTSPFFPFRSYFNDTLTAIPFDPLKAKKQMEEAGQPKLTLRYSYRKGNAIAQQIGQLLQAEARKGGWTIQLQPMEFATLMQHYRQRDYDLLYASWTRPPSEDDPFLLWHTQSDQSTGLNRVGYGRAQTDAWIDSIRATPDPAQRAHYFRLLQADIYDEQPYVFLFSPRHQIVARKGLQLHWSPIRPGYFFREEPE